MAEVYVGTYAKYNSGSLKGAWLDLEAFADLDDFLEECKKLHEDEADPELMFQDYMDFPKKFYGESHISPELWDWLALDERDRELVSAFWSGVDESATVQQAIEAFRGRFRDEAEWAEDYLEATGALSEVPPGLRYYIDFEGYARDTRLNGDMVFVQHDGDTYAFSNHY